MPTLGPFEVMVILVIVLVIFGGGRIGELGGAVGRTVREFRSSVKGEDTARNPATVTHVKTHEPAPTVVSTHVAPASPANVPPVSNVTEVAPEVGATHVIIDTPAASTAIPKSNP